MDSTNVKILLIEDDEDDYIIVRDLLAEIERARFTLDWIPTYEEALAEISRCRHDVYLLDYFLGGRNGLDLLDEAVNRLGCRAPIIFLTGQGDYEVDIKAMQAGAADYLVKGQMSPAILERSIRYSIMHARVEDELRRAREEMERRVVERTRELATANERLNKELLERKQAEEAISRAKREWELTFDAVPDLIAIMDEKNRVVRINRALAERLRTSTREVAGKKCFACFHGTDAPPPFCPHNTMVNDHREHTFEIREHHLGGDFLITVSPIHDREGRVTGTVHVARDITERKQLEEERMKSSKLESIGILAGGIAHDFNNLLTAILGNISLAKRYIPPTNEAFKNLGRSETAILQATALTQRLLTFSQGGAPLKKKAQIAGLIRDTVAFHLSGSNILCRYTLPDNLWLVECDAGQIAQMMGNLVINAKEAMPNGGVLSVQARNVTQTEHPFLPDGKFVAISLEDQGTGIPQENLEHIFDPYFSTKDKVSEKGMGLGLAIVHSIVKRHGGIITVESEMGEGATFHVYLPAVGEGKAPVREGERESFQGSGKVLLMDDEESVRRVGAELLELLGYKVYVAANGEEALEVCRVLSREGDPLQAAILDLTIPGGLGGKDAVTQIRMICPPIKAVVSSGYSNDPVMAQPTRYGFDAAVAKPYTLEELGRTLHRLLNGRTDSDTLH